MSKEIKLEAGQWYRRRDKSIVYCLGFGPCKDNKYPVLVTENEDCDCTEWYKTDGTFTNNSAGSTNDIVEHLPDCTGFDWVAPPKAPKYRPFKNAEEFKPHRDKWWKKVGDDDRIYPPSYYNDKYHGGLSFEYCLQSRFFEDGTPFGVEVS